MAADYPKTTADVTPGWLTEHLRAAGTIPPDVAVTDAVPHVLDAGVGFMGEVGILDLTYEGATEAPSRMVAKIPTQEPFVRDMLRPAQVFEREARFYLDVAPNLPGLVPDTYFVGCDTASDEYFLLMEDLSSLRCGDQFVGCSVDDAAAAVDAAAAFHARYWQNDALAAVDWMPPVNSDGQKIGQMIYESSLPGFLEVFGDVIDPANESLVQRFGANVPQLLDRLAAMPTTISHFDFRLDNLLFDSSGETEGGVRMIDFQICSKGGGVYDVAYLLSQSMNVDDRRSHEDDLLVRYHDALVGHGVDGYTIDQIRHDYRIGTLYGWVIPVFAIGTLDTSSERAMALWTNVIERAQAALMDHDVGEFLTA